MEPCDLTAVEARRQIGTGELTSVDLTTSCLERIDAIDPAVNAMITRAGEQALASAAAADDMTPGGPLHGLPVAIKDLQPTANLRTTYGSPSHANHVPETDAGIVGRIRAAGGIVIGKTNIPEFSIGANTVNPLFGATGNPFAVDLTCGGSSGGSAVAVSTAMAPLATGSDHGGSLRIPASYCGVVGFRATPGVVPHELRNVTQTFYSVQGPMARTVEDTALLLSVIAGRSRLDPMAFPLDAAALARLDPIDVEDLRVGVSEDLGGLLVSSTIRRTFSDRAQRLERIVGSVREPTIDLRTAPDVDWRIRSDLFVAQYARDADSWNDDFNPNIRQSYDSAIATPMADIAAARRTQMDLYQSFQAIFDEVDVLICPTVSVPPFPWSQRNPTDVDGVAIENYMAWLALTSSISVVGHPAVALPCGLDEHGTPFGVQIIGPAYDDRRLLSIAHALEAALAEDPVTTRPIPDIATLESTVSSCRELGRTV
ncbi:MAG: amidase [Acidimicrobiaceae bacterium]|jgi:amidase|nr:amidase [Acidimicrobiaceae bacterium]MBT5849038.1 amidase [Acidimicrobiaceae bacterium]